MRGMFRQKRYAKCETAKWMLAPRIGCGCTTCFRARVADTLEQHSSRSLDDKRDRAAVYRALVTRLESKT